MAIKHKYKSFDSEAKLCRWLDENLNINIVAITQDRMMFTVFYREYLDDEILRQLEETCCDPDFLVPLKHQLPTSRTAPNQVTSPVHQYETICGCVPNMRKGTPISG